MCSGEACLSGSRVIPLAIKQVSTATAKEKGMNDREIKALKATQGAKHMIQSVDYKFSEDKTQCFILTR